MDIRVAGGGSVVLLFPLTPLTEEWIADNVGDDAMWHGGGLAVESRYVQDILDGMEEAGLEVGS